jgi:molybdopterin converting factor small subunit
MTATIKVAAYLHPYIDGKIILKVEGNTVRECLHNLIVQFPEIEIMLFDEKKRLLDYISIFIAGDVAYDDQMDIPVKDGDILNILYIIGGG